MHPRNTQLYPLLGLDHHSNPTTDAIRKAYLSKALELHPDKNLTKPHATSLFQNLKKAYETIISSVATAEEENEDISRPKPTHNWDSETESDEEVLLKLPKREDKKVDRVRRKEENAINQANAQVERKREHRELKSLEREPATQQHNLYKCARIFSTQANAYLELSIPDIQDRVLALRTRMNNLHRKKLRSQLNTGGTDMPMTAEEAAIEEEQIEAVVEAEFEAWEQDEEFLEFEMPMGFVDPLEYHRVIAQRRPSLIFLEEEETERARKLAEKLALFWDEKKASEAEVKEPRIVLKEEQDVAGEVFKPAAIEYTKEYLEQLADYEAVALLDQHTISAVEIFEPGLVILPNDNLTLSHQFVADSSKGELKQNEGNALRKKKRDHPVLDFDPLDQHLDRGRSRRKLERERGLILDGW